MAVEKKDIWIFGATVHPEDDTTSDVGGAVDTGTKMTFSDPAAASTFKMYANAADTNAITVTGRNAAGAIVSEAETLNGTTGSTETTASLTRILKATINGNTASVAAAIATTGTTPTTGTAQSATATTLVLANGAVSTDGDFKHQVLRITGGTDGVGELAEIIDSVASTDTVYIRQWGEGDTPTGTITYSIAPGVVFENYTTPAITIDTVRRPFYDAAAPSSSTRDYYEKIFVGNEHATTALTNATLDELTNGSIYSKVYYFAESTVNGSGTCDDRLTEPSGSPSWEDTDSIDLGDAGDGTLGAGEEQGIWVKLALSSSDTAANSYWEVQVSGQST